MSELPASWTEVSLEDVASWGSGGTPSRKNPEYFVGTIPWLKTGELGEKYVRVTEEHISQEAVKSSAAKLYPKGAVCVAMYGATIGKASILAIEATTNQACAVGLPHADVLDAEFLYYFLTSEKRAFINAGIGGAQPNISQGVIKSWPFPLPPLPEQKRIVAKIEELFSELEAGEESLRVARRQLGVYRQSLLKQAFEGKLTAKWRTQNLAKLESPASLLARIQTERRSRYEKTLKKSDARDRSDNLPKQAKPRAPLPVSPLESEVLSALPQLPDGWTWAKMEDTCDVVRGGSPRPAGDPKYYDGEIPFLKVADLTRVEGPYVDNFTSTIKAAGLQKTRYVEPPVLLISNSGATLGVPRICRIAATFNDGVAAFLDLNPETHRYFYFFWTSKTEALRNIDQGAAQPNLNTDLLKAYPVPLCSLPEQQEIVRVLDEQFEGIERNEREIDGALRSSEALRQAILKKAFTGRLVPQDPSDEPASQLLARLRAERNAAPEAASRRNRKTAKLAASI